MTVRAAAPCFAARATRGQSPPHAPPHAPAGAYLRDGWNAFDFFIVVVSLLNYVLAVDVRALKALRSMRALRALRLVRSLEGLRYGLCVCVCTQPGHAAP